ncbi:MAG TPA: hypothetical protein VGR51_06865 [Thermoplasmata archaeon]|nr:hypothetical protein [Thermoplasmata archaeon]
MQMMRGHVFRTVAIVLVALTLLGGVFVVSPDTADAAKGGGDTTPPVRSDGAPTGSLPSGTTSTTISLKTDEPATCRYATTAGIAFGRMRNGFSATGGTSHATTVGGLEDGNTYTFYVRCRDLARNANPDDYPITFSVRSEDDCGTPSTNAYEAWSAPAGTPGSPSSVPVGTWKAVASPSVESASPSITVDNTLQGIAAIGPDDVWAVGFANNPDGPQYSIQTLALHWDGAGWSIVPTPNAPTDWSRLYGVAATSSNDVWAVGTSQDVAYVPLRTLIQHWNGTEWSIVPSPSPGTVVNELRALAVVSANDAWAVGFCAGWYRSSTVILHWDGAVWSRVPSPNPNAGFANNELYGIAAIAADDIWAVGVSGSYAPLALHWDGVAWTAVPTANGGGYGAFFRSVSGSSSGDVLAVGASVYPAGLEGGIRHLAFAARWDGTAWTQITDIALLDSGEYYSSSNFYGVSAVANDFAWVVGDASGDAWLFHWDGTSLREVPAPDLPWYNSLYAVDALSPDLAWAVGRYAIEGEPGTNTLTERYSVP